MKSSLWTIVFFCLPLLGGGLSAGELWRLGIADGSSLEFGGTESETPWNAFQTDFLEPRLIKIGEENAVKKWPKFHPGPLDFWAGEKVHTFSVLFDAPGDTVTPPAASVELVLSLAGHPGHPPKLEVNLNGHATEFIPEKDAHGDAQALMSLAGNGTSRDYTIRFPISLLKTKNNKLSVSAKEGSWLVYDALVMSTSDQPPTETAVLGAVRHGKRKEVRTFIVTFKSHFDIGYTGLARDVVNEFRSTMIDQALDVIERNKQLPKNEQFIWTVPGWPLQQMLWEGQTDERRRIIENAIKNGNLVVHALPCTTHTETLGLEELVRGMQFSTRLAKKYGLDIPADGKMTDVPCHSWYLPTIAAHAGIKFLHLGCNNTSTPLDVPMLFWWEGPDGSKTLTMYNHFYGTPLLPPGVWNYPVWLALVHAGDNAGPPSPRHVRDVINTIRREYPDATIKIGRMSDFYDALMSDPEAADFLPRIPVIRKDMPDTWIHGPMSNPVGSRIAHTIRPAIAAAENLAALSHLLGIKSSLTAAEREKLADQVYEQSLMYGEHTWGLDTTSNVKLKYGKEWDELLEKGLPDNFLRCEDSWNEHESYIRKAEELLQPFYEETLQTLANSVPAEKPFVVYNPLPWERSALVRIGSQVIDARDVPTSGYKTFSLRDCVKPAGHFQINKENHSVETPYFKVTFDMEKGCIKSLVDKKTGRELVDSSAPFGFGQYLYQREDSETLSNYVRAYVRPADQNWAALYYVKMDMPKDFQRFDVTSGPVSKVEYTDNGDFLLVKMTSQFEPAVNHLDGQVHLDVKLFADNPSLELEFRCSKKTDGWPEASWICLPLAVKEPEFKLGRLGAITDMATEMIDKSNYDMIWLNTGLAALDKSGCGVGICPMDSPLVSIGEPGAHKYTQRYKQRPAWIYVNLYNNQWHTNFRSWWGGTLQSRIRIWPIEHYDPERSLITPSMEARVPIVGVVQKSQPDSTTKLPSESAGAAVSRKGIICTAFYWSDEQKGFVLRLWELAGKDGPCTITLPPGMRSCTAQQTDLRGTFIGEPIVLSDGTFTVPISHFAPVTFLLTL